MGDDDRQLPLWGVFTDSGPVARPTPSKSCDVSSFGVSIGWVGEAERAVLEVASKRKFFTTDEVWATGLEPPAEPRALGAVLKRAAGFNIIERTDRFRATKRRSRRGAPIAIWRSRLEARS